MPHDNDNYGDGIPDEVRRAMASGNGMVIPIRSGASPEEMAATIAESIRMMRGQVTGEELADELSETLRVDALQREVDALPGVARWKATLAARIERLPNFVTALPVAERIAHVANTRAPAFTDDTWAKVVDVTLWLAIRSLVIEQTSARIDEALASMKADAKTCECDVCMRARESRGSLADILADFLNLADDAAESAPIPDPPRTDADAKALRDDFLTLLYGSDAPRCVTCDSPFSRQEFRAGMRTCEHCPPMNASGTEDTENGD